MCVHYNDRRDINWEFIGQRLERSPNICRFMYQIIEWQWYQSKHHDSAMTLKKLQAQMRQHDAGATIKQLHSRRFPALPGVPKDQRLETRGWIRLLCHPPDPVYKSTVDDDVNTCRRWTAEEHDRFVDMLTVHQRPPASVLEEIAQALDRSRKAVLERFNIIRYRTSAKDAAPLTDDERKTILDQAAKQSGLLRWGDVKGLLPGRTYAEVNRQLTYSSTRKCPHPQQSANE
ncbi:hypothetical protein GGF46_001476 [Coemansia sp. RSA 552]|nr:hypothetical protein GGF46_001476 [Coemansia sp. RSA 552]